MPADSPAADPDRTPTAPRTLAERYAMPRWSRDYFRVNERGHVAVHPDPQSDRSIDLKHLVENLERRGLGLPLLIRFDGILKHRIDELHHAFTGAIEEFDYQGRYRFVYPVKVNQQRHVVEQVLNFGRPYGFGVEAGSKPELLAVLALIDDDDTPIICNGFKDAEFIEGVILAKKIGKHIIPVVENFNELELIVRYARAHGVSPSIGVRVKLATRGAGRWQSSSGYGSKFGLTVSRLLEALAYLREQGMADCLNLLHFHIGSQIAEIQNVKRAIVEATRIYVELKQAGADLQYLDVGGGLGVDYGETTSSYTLQEYANDVIYYVREVCNQHAIDHPTIVSESGRAVTAHHSVLVFNTLAVSERQAPQNPIRPSGEAPTPVRRLFDIHRDLNRGNLVESFHDSQLAWDETQSSFNLGYCSLEHRAAAEHLYYGICAKALQIAETMEDTPEEFAQLESLLASTYFVNVSIFQSLPDCWAIDQLFPILPIHRLHEPATRRGILADITCDSDGKLDRFIQDEGVRPVLNLHSPNGQDYLLGAFLVGAYQEILGDMHNLFGDTNAVHIELNDADDIVVNEIVEGDSIREVLEYVQYRADDLKRSMRHRIERALRERKLSLEESTLLRRFYESGLEGYTYLE